MNRPPPSTTLVAAALVTVYVVWGSTYLAIALMIQTLPPLLAAAVRYLLAGGLLLGFLWLRSCLPGRQRIAWPTGRQWRSATIVGGLLLLGGNGLVVLSEQRIPSGIAALVVATVPIWLSIIDAVVTRRRPSRLAIAGLAAGIVGVAILVAPIQGGEPIDLLGAAMVLVATLSWAAGSIYSRGADFPPSQLVATGAEMFAGGVLLGLAGSATGELTSVHPASFSAVSLLALGYLVTFGSILAFSAYTWLLSNVATSVVATYAYVNPVVAVALGALVLSEPITPRTVVAAVVIIGAVVAMVSGRPRSDAAARTEADEADRANERDAAAAARRRPEAVSEPD